MILQREATKSNNGKGKSLSCLSLRIPLETKQGNPSPQEVTATVSVPQNIGAGGRYAIIHIATLPTSGSGVNILSAIDVPVVLTVTGSQLIHTGKITDLSISEPVNGQPINILTTFQNTGNHHFKVKGEVTISDPNGKTMDTISSPLGISSIVPTMSVQSKCIFTPTTALKPGIYAVQSKVFADDGVVLDIATGSFTVGASGIAPVSSPSPVPTAKPALTTTIPASLTPGGPMATMPPPEPPINWAVIGGIIGAVVLGLVILFVWRRKLRH
jgi:hypothetical protein